MRIEDEKTDIDGVCVEEDHPEDPDASDSTEPLEPNSDGLEGQEYPSDLAWASIAASQSLLFEPLLLLRLSFSSSPTRRGETGDLDLNSGGPPWSSSTDLRNASHSFSCSKYLHLYSACSSVLPELGDGGDPNQPLSALAAVRGDSSRACALEPHVSLVGKERGENVRKNFSG